MMKFAAHREKSTVWRSLGSSLITMFSCLVVVLVTPAALQAQPKPRPGDTNEKGTDARDRLNQPKTDDKEKSPDNDDDDEAKHSLSGDGIGAFPVGDYGEFAGIGAGLGLRYDYPISERLGFVGHVAYLYHFENDARDQSDVDFSQTVTEFLLMAGVTYSFPIKDGDDSMFIAAQAGLNWLSVDTVFEDTMTLQDSSITDREYAILLTGGYEFDVFSARGGLLISAIGRETQTHIADETPLTDYAGTMSVVGMFGYRFYVF